MKRFGNIFKGPDADHSPAGMRAASEDMQKFTQEDLKYLHSLGVQVEADFKKEARVTAKAARKQKQADAAKHLGEIFGGVSDTSGATILFKTPEERQNDSFVELQPFNVRAKTFRMRMGRILIGTSLAAASVGGITTAVMQPGQLMHSERQPELNVPNRQSVSELPATNSITLPTSSEDF